LPRAWGCKGRENQWWTRQQAVQQVGALLKWKGQSRRHPAYIFSISISCFCAFPFHREWIPVASCASYLSGIDRAWMPSSFVVSTGDGRKWPSIYKLFSWVAHLCQGRAIWAARSHSPSWSWAHIVVSP
jgi:hypothetical protein